MAYRECCIQNYVSNPRFKRCPECGKTFYPCKSCPSLSDKHSHCPVCIYPQFLWKSPHPLKAGEMGAVELVVENQGKKNFFVQAIHYHLSGTEPQEKSPEEGLSPGQSRVFLLDCLNPPSAGAYSLAAQVTLSWRENGSGYSQEEWFVYAGEILLTSMEQNGRQNGYDLALTKAVTGAVKIPMIASGEVGKPEHIYDALVNANASGTLLASTLHKLLIPPLSCQYPLCQPF